MLSKHRLFIQIIAFAFNYFYYRTCRAQYDLQVITGQVYQEIINPTYEIPDHSPYFGNVNTKPEMLFNAFDQNYDLSDNVYIVLKQGYCYFENGQHSVTLYSCKGNYTKRPGQTSVFSFKTDTTAGNKIFIMQWKNMGFINGRDTDYINFQVWLYNQNNLIEFRYGPNKVRPGLYENGANGPTIGLLDMDALFSSVFNQIWLKGQTSTPMLVNSNGIVNLDQTPNNGTVYKFSYNANGINPSNSYFRYRVYPVPVIDRLFLQWPENSIVASVSIMNTIGQAIIQLSDTDNMKEIDVSSLSSDIYFAIIKDQFGVIHKTKFFKE